MKPSSLFRIFGAALCLLALIILLSKLIVTSANGRILGDILQNIFLLSFCLFLVFPDERQLRNAIIIGVYTTVLDFVLETMAVYLAWWYPLGGTQMPPLLVVPLEMVLGFFFFGTAVGIIFTIPRKIRDLDVTTSEPRFTTKCTKFIQRFCPRRWDFVWLIGFVFVSAVIGMNGDYNAGPNAWVPGPGWQPVYTFLVWFLSGLSMLAIYFILDKRSFK